MQRINRTRSSSLFCILVLTCACAESERGTNGVHEDEQDATACAATVFEDCDFAGAAVCLQAGTYDRSQLVSKGMPNRSISSVKVSSGYQLQLFTQNYQEGRSKTFSGDDRCLVSSGWNDRAVSAQVSATGTAGTGGSGGVGGTGGTTSGGSGGDGGAISGGSGGTDGGSGSSGAAGSGNTGNTGGSSGSLWKPTPGLRWQWNISGSIDTSKDVPVFDIDLFDAPQSKIDELHAKGRRVICYFSAGSSEDWRPDFSQFQSSDLGATLDGWAGERWLDTRSANVREIMKRRIELAMSKHCDAVEPDNVDGYQNNNGLGLTQQTAIDYIQFLTNEAHARNLSIGLKNALDIVPSLVDVVDWALNEQCSEYDECDALLPFIDKNKAVFNCEYDASAFNQVCADSRFDRFSSILKSLSLTADPLSFCP